MNKTAIKNFAIWARVTLLEAVKQKAYEYAITETGGNDPNAQIVSGRPLTVQEKQQRRELIAQIESKKFDQVMEEAAYTWFNRFIALRYMEVNGYLPSRVRVFTNEMGEFKPEILKEAMTVDLPGLEREKILELLEKQDNEALYKLLLIAQCNALSESLPRMFEKIANWTELLFPGNLLKSDSVPGRMVADIPEEDWTDQVQIIGWLYQYYNTELKDDTFAQLKKNVKISKERIPAATQLFTPDWIVRYMVENSMGRIYISEQCSADNEQERIAQEKAIAEKMGWKYYLPEAQQSPEVRAQLNSLTTDHSSLNTIKIIDPCIGSGHILVYAFEVLMQIYLEIGYNQRDAAQSILENNLYGLDIDDRAAQLAYFAVMMKARSYDRRLFSRNIQPHVYAIRESNGVSPQVVDCFCNGDGNLKSNLTRVMEQMKDAKEYGSILNVTGVDFAALYTRFDEIREEIHILRQSALEQLLPMVQCAQLLAQKYHVVVTNPPYLGNSRFSPKLNEYVAANYSDVKADLSMVMYKHALQDLCIKNGFTSFVTTTSWMFLSSFEKLRSYILAAYDFQSLVDYGTELFDGKVGHNPIVAWINRKSHTECTMSAIRLVDYCYSRRDEKESEFFENRNRYYAKQANFSKIPGSPVAYWVSENFVKIYQMGHPLSEYAIVFEGLKTRDKDRFLRLWFEVNDSKWIHYAKGGAFRRWYGNGEYVVNWGKNGDEVRAFKKSSGANFLHYFIPTITYSALTSYKYSARYIDSQLFGGGGGGITKVQELWYVLALVNSCVFHYLLTAISPTLNFEVGQIGMQPIIIDEKVKKTVSNVSAENIELSKTDWDSYEISWDFKRNPLV